MAFKFKQKDIVILTIAAIFLGIFITLQYSQIKLSNNSYESSDTMALEIERLAKNNADMKNQLNDLTKKYQIYKESLNNQSELGIQITKDLKGLDVVNASSTIAGQGVEIIVNDDMLEVQVIDLINAIKNIGADAIAINGRRLNLYTPLTGISLKVPNKIEIVGNSAVLEGALNRRGGIIEQLKMKGMDVQVNKVTAMTLAASEQKEFLYAKIEDN